MATTTEPTTSLLRGLVEDLAERRETAKLGGGTAKIEKQHSRDKLTARERLELLIDPGTWVEMGLHAGPNFAFAAGADVDAPADGVVTGYGRVDGRLVAVAAYDFTVMAAASTSARVCASWRWRSGFP
jgi:acetyl-CoA carboxylase carboxyltransferase component